MNDDTKLLIDEFASYCTKQVQDWLNNIYKDSEPPQEKVVVKDGRKYIKLVTVRGDTTKRVYGFIDTTNGDLLKAATLKAPAKHARGSLYKKETWGCANHQGIDKDVREDNRRDKLIEQSIEKRGW